MRELLRQLRMQSARKLAVMLRDLRARAAAAREAEEGEVRARREASRWIGHRQLAELHEMIAAAARPKLRPGAILHARRHRCHVPVAIHDVVPALRLELRAHAE